MKLKCIDNTGYTDCLTIGQKYKIIEIDEHEYTPMYTVINDKKKRIPYWSWRFEPMKLVKDK